MIVKKYIYDGKEYFSEKAVRKAVFEKERLAFGVCNTSEDWSLVGVAFVEETMEANLDELKERKRRKIKQAFLDWRNDDAVLMSSLGFKIDSNERANTDIAGLLVANEGNKEQTVVFRDADNVFRNLSYDQLKTLQIEIVENGNHAYAQKWKYDALVDSAESKADLNDIEIKFEGKNFFQE